jgi:hypothetical protein
MTLADFLIVWLGKMTKGIVAFVVQSSTEANSKNGSQHEGSTYIPELAGSGVNNTIFLTGDLPVILKGRNLAFDGLGVIASIFEGPTYTGGVDTAYQNASAINPKEGLSKILVGSSVTSDGVLKFAPNNIIGSSSNQSRGSTGSVAGGERILKPNTAYLLKILSLDPADQAVTSYLSWYEGELDLPDND